MQWKPLFLFYFYVSMSGSALWESFCFVHKCGNFHFRSHQHTVGSSCTPVTGQMCWKGAAAAVGVWANKLSVKIPPTVRTHTHFRFESDLPMYRTYASKSTKCKVSLWLWTLLWRRKIVNINHVNQKWQPQNIHVLNFRLYLQQKLLILLFIESEHHWTIGPGPGPGPV